MNTEMIIWLVDLMLVALIVAIHVIEHISQKRMVVCPVCHHDHSSTFLRRNLPCPKVVEFKENTPDWDWDIIESPVILNSYGHKSADQNAWISPDAYRQAYGLDNLPY